MLEDDAPQPPPILGRPALDPLGIDELKDYIVSLRAEIARAEAAIERKQGHRAAAASFFRTP